MPRGISNWPCGQFMSAKASATLRASAAVVLTRGHGDALETYWVRRSDQVSYMPGFRSFLGGSVDAEDAELPVEGSSDEQDRILRACAIREAFEEAGVLTREASFHALARERGWSFQADALTYAGRWITPPFAPRRFETAYFLARVPA